MRESLLYRIRKNALYTILTLMLIASMTVASAQPAHATQQTILSVEPTEYEAPAPGHNFMISIVITNVSRLGAISFKLGYNTTLLDAVWCSLTSMSETWLSDFVPAPWNETIGIVDEQGYVVFGALAKDLLDPFIGSGAILTINFTATVTGSGLLDLYETIVQGIDPDLNIYPIEHEVVGGSITVIPEFPTSLVMPLLLIATLAATFLGKFWSRKREDVSS